MSTMNYTSGSNEVEIYVHPYHKVKIMTIGGVVLLLICLAVISMLVYAKRNRIKKFREAENVKI